MPSSDTPHWNVAIYSHARYSGVGPSLVQCPLRSASPLLLQTSPTHAARAGCSNDSADPRPHPARHQTRQYEKRCFGFSADIYEPRQSWHGDWEVSTVNWGIISAVKVADARDLIRMRIYAANLAEWLNARREQRYAEDMAD